MDRRARRLARDRPARLLERHARGRRRAVCKDPATYSSWLGGFTMRAAEVGSLDVQRSVMIGKDGAEHARMRGTVSKAFTPWRVRDLEPAIRERTRSRCSTPCSAAGGVRRRRRPRRAAGERDDLRPARRPRGGPRAAEPLDRRVPRRRRRRARRRHDRRRGAGERPPSTSWACMLAREEQPARRPRSPPWAWPPTTASRCRARSRSASSASCSPPGSTRPRRRSATGS